MVTYLPCESAIFRTPRPAVQQRSCNAAAVSLILHIQLRHLHHTEIHVNLEPVRDVARMKNLGEDKSKLGSQRVQAI